MDKADRGKIFAYSPPSLPVVLGGEGEEIVRVDGKGLRVLGDVGLNVDGRILRDVVATRYTLTGNSSVLGSCSVSPIRARGELSSM